MPNFTPRTLVRVITAALFTAIAAVIWDGWWHVALGRDSVWILPHLLLYVSTGTAVGFGVYGWFRNKRAKAFKHLALILLLIPASAPFDELWHRIFGMEALNSVWILWSPPHLVLIAALLGSFLLLLPLLRKDSLGAQQVFGALAVAGIAQLFVALAAPFLPTGPFALLGFWGAGIVAAALTAGLLLASRLLPGPAPVFLVALALAALHALGVEGDVAPGVIVAPHDHAPSWLVVFSLVVPAVLIDLMRGLPSVMLGSIYGLVWAYILFTFSGLFFAPQFQYPFAAAVVAVISAYIGGGAGWYVSAFILDKITPRKKS